jgi:hypothetical protein
MPQAKRATEISADQRPTFVRSFILNGAPLESERRVRTTHRPSNRNQAVEYDRFNLFAVEHAAVHTTAALAILGALHPRPATV